MRIGKRGIEKAADRALRGKPGFIRMEVDAAGRVKRELDRADGGPGANVVLTIDAELQQFVAERLGDLSASAVVMDVFTGDVLAMVSVPGFDGNAFARGISQPEWQRLLTDPRRPLLNKAAQGVYPPGSTYKIVTTLAALESRALSVSDRLFCGGSIDLPGRDQKKYCWIYPGGHGWLNVTEALQHSCDVFFYEAAKRAGVEHIVHIAAKLGFGKPTDAGLPEEAAGLLPTPGWTLQRTGKPWTIGNTYNLGIGQGDMLATPLQLALMAARIANGRHGVKPRLVVGIADPAPAPSLSFRAENLRAVQNGMDLVVNSPNGTAFASRISERGMAMAGKTGTSQVRRMTEGERDRRISQEQLPWQLRHHALFCAYAPVDNPRYACAVVVEHGMGGVAHRRADRARYLASGADDRPVRAACTISAPPKRRHLTRHSKRPLRLVTSIAARCSGVSAWRNHAPVASSFPADNADDCRSLGRLVVCIARSDDVRARRVAADPARRARGGVVTSAIAFGSVLPLHVVACCGQGRNRITGLSLAGATSVLIVSALVLDYGGEEALA